MRPLVGTFEPPSRSQASILLLAGPRASLRALAHLAPCAPALRYYHTLSAFYVLPSAYLHLPLLFPVISGWQLDYRTSSRRRKCLRKVLHFQLYLFR